MRTFRNKNFTKRDYECTNIVFCQAEVNPDQSKWTECNEENIEDNHCVQLYMENNVRYFGYL